MSTEITPQKVENEDKADHSIQFDFWKDTPVVKEFDPDYYWKVITPTPRGTILDILVEGIKEPHPKKTDRDTDKPQIRTRRALSATEILDRLNGSEKKGIKGRLHGGDKIKRTNLYFHLDKLEDAGVIKVIDEIRTGKRTTTYYGRTAKVIIPHTGKKNAFDNSIVNEEEFMELLTDIDPSINLAEFKMAKDAISKIYNHSIHDKIEEWFEENRRNLRGREFDLRKLYNLISIILRYDEQTVEGLTILSKYLKLPKL